MIFSMSAKIEVSQQAKRWVVTQASLRGKSHIQSGAPCQDALGHITLSNGWGLAVVCDGAGSYKHAGDGAAFASNRALELFSGMVQNYRWDADNVLPRSKTWRTLSRKALKQIHLDLQLYAQTRELPNEQLSCTIIVVIYCSKGILTTHVGDGRAAYRNAHRWEPIMTPFEGRQASSTVFLTMNIWSSSLMDRFVESRRIKGPVYGFTLMSDGCEFAAYRCRMTDRTNSKVLKLNNPEKAFLDPNMRALLKMFAKGMSQEQINERWKQFLDIGNEVLQRETDDKTMIFGVLTKRYIHVQRLKGKQG